MRAFKSRVFALAAICALVALSASSALAGAYSVGAIGGFGAPMSDLKDVYGAGWNLGGQADYNFAPMLGVGLDAGYHTWNAKNDVEAALALLAMLAGAPAGTTVDVKLNALQYGVHGTLTPPIVGPIHPYVQVGLSEYNMKESITSNYPLLVGDISKTLLGYNAGAGVNFTMMPTLSLGIDGRYHYVNSKDDFGANATWFDVNAKLTFHVPLAK